MSAASAIARAVSTSAADIPLRPTFVAFTPWTTLTDYLELVEFILQRDLVRHVDPVQLVIRLPRPPRFEPDRDAGDGSVPGAV